MPFNTEGGFNNLDEPSNNTPPVSTDPADQTLASGAAFTVVFNLSDTDVGDVLGYALLDVNSSGVTLNEDFTNNVLTVTGTGPTGPASITLRVTPNDGTENGTAVETVLTFEAPVTVTTKRVTFELPTQIQTKANMVFNVIKSDGSSVASGNLVTSNPTVEIDLDADATLVNNQPLIMVMTDRFTISDEEVALIGVDHSTLLVEIN